MANMRSLVDHYRVELGVEMYINLDTVPASKRWRRTTGIVLSSIALTIWTEERARIVSVGPRMNVGLTTTNSVSPPSRSTKSHTVRSRRRTKSTRPAWPQRREQRSGPAAFPQGQERSPHRDRRSGSSAKRCGEPPSAPPRRTAVRTSSSLVRDRTVVRTGRPSASSAAISRGQIARPAGHKHRAPRAIASPRPGIMSRTRRSPRSTGGARCLHRGRSGS
jgi:hypothetical protein